MKDTGRTEYKNEWQKNHTDRIALNVPKGYKEKIRDHAHGHGESINGFLNRAIGETMAHDQEKDEREQQIAQIVGESGKSPEEAEHDIEIEEALAILQREVSNIREFYFYEKQCQQYSARHLIPPPPPPNVPTIIPGR